MKKYALLIIILLVVAIAGAGAYLMKEPQAAPTGHVDRGVVRGTPSEDQPAAQSHRSYALEIISGVSDVKPRQETKIVYTIVNDQGEVLKNFETVHEKIMHFIVVRKDLQGFQHLHPTFNQTTGEFTVAVTFPTDGPYRMFPDFTPAKVADNPMLLPVTLNQDVQAGSLVNYKSEPITADVVAEKSVGNYQISFATPNLLPAQTSVSYTLTVKKDGKPVTNLEKYLGALGHSVILKEDTLDFIHTHAETAATKGPDITFTTSFPEPGLYKTFTQFQHEGKVITTDYVVAVAPGKMIETPQPESPHGGTTIQH